METLFYAFIGALLLILTQLKLEKNRRDRDPSISKKIPWSKFIAQNWDDFLYAIVCALFLGYLQADIFSALIRWRDWNAKEAWDIYRESEFVISVGCGLFGTLIVQQIFSLGIKLIGKVSK